MNAVAVILVSGKEHESSAGARPDPLAVGLCCRVSGPSRTWLGTWVQTSFPSLR